MLQAHDSSHATRIATEIVTILTNAGHTALFAGGWVRDMLLGNPSCDIDIATSALPDTVSTLFPQSILVGAQFGVVIVRYKGLQFEVATFRQDYDYVDGRRPQHITLQSTPEEDAKRRDFTINGMFYDPLKNLVIDYVGGKVDLENKVIRCIGNPLERFKEDRLRMVRAIRFSKRLNFVIESQTQEAIRTFSHELLPCVSMERIWQELDKMRHGPNFIEALLEMQELGLLPTIFKSLEGIPTSEIARRLSGLENVDDHTPTILFLVFLFETADSSFYKELQYYLKISTEDGKWIENWLEVKRLLTKEISLMRYEWLTLLVNPKTEVSLKTLLAHMQSYEQRQSIEKSIDDLIKEYAFHLTLFKKRTPLIRAEDLLKEGITPGKKMGKLLEEANRLAVSEDIQDTKNLMTRLKNSPNWNMP